MKNLKSIISYVMVLCCVIIGFKHVPINAYGSQEWPGGVEIQAESGIVIDANSGAVLYGRNIHTPYFPASITKIMTALIVLERANMEDMVTYSYEAVHNVEANSSNAGISAGEQMTVKDSLYALLQKSANEAANALAEHVSGSIEEFAVLMNERAKELGCSNTNFVNPSGLNDPEHYTSAYDMALISKEAFQNPAFVEINSTLKYTLPPTMQDPQGLVISPSHRMMKPGSYYYPGIIGGKTGYTVLAGNTLVTCAQRNGMTLIAVVLKGSTPQYWSDSRALLDFGFDSFQSIPVEKLDPSFLEAESLSFRSQAVDSLSILTLDDGHVTLPNGVSLEHLTKSISYDLGKTKPTTAIGKVDYFYGETFVGGAYITMNPKNLFSNPAGASSKKADKPDASTLLSKDVVGESPTVSKTKTLVIGTVITVFLLFIGVGGFLWFRTKRNRRQRAHWAKQRQQRLLDAGISHAEFEHLLNTKRNSYTSRKSKKRRNSPRFK